MKADIPTSDGHIEVDFSEMEKRLLEKLSGEAKVQMEQYFKENHEAKAASTSKGVVEAFAPEAKKAVVEEFQKGENCNPAKIKEQWTIVIPKYAIQETAAHLRDFVWVTDVV